jgi:preprotein translocase subunit SecY
MLTVPLAIMQSYAMITLLQKSGQGVLGELTMFRLITSIITITGGTVFLMWIGELISEKKVGNGISLLIFAGIIAGVPTAVQQTLAVFDTTQIIFLVVFVVIAVLTIMGVVIVTEGQRKIPINYARRIKGNRIYGGTSTFLPMRVNQAGVIPIIFAISLVLIPPMIGQFLTSVNMAWLANAGQFIVDFFNNQLFYAIMYFVLVVVFTYFYTAVIFHPDQISENLQKQGGFIPGIRPGYPTTQYLKGVSSRILLAGALFLGIIAILPLIMRSAFNMQTMVIGGTSLLIVVSVVIETVRQIESQLVMRDYEGFY